MPKYTIYFSRTPYKYRSLQVYPPLSMEYVFNPDRQVEAIQDMPDKFLCWSQILLNKIGEKIKRGELNKDDFLIYCEDIENHFNEAGVLENWQYGLFDSTID